MTLKFADGTDVFVENFWKGNYAELGCFIEDFFTMCRQTHDECSHEKRTDGIVTVSNSDPIVMVGSRLHKVCNSKGE